MAGYSRQSVADIISGEVVKAAPLNAEFNALRDAFAFVGGHNHDGSSVEGAYVGLIADTDGNNKVVVDTANNRVSIYTEVSSAAVEQIRIQDGAIVPVTDDDIDLGASGAEFKNLWIDGTANIDALVSAAVTLTGGTIDGTTIGASTAAAGTFTDLTSTGTSTHATVDINGGTIDGTTIGASSATAGSFTTVSTSGQATLATADINGGTVDGAVIGGATPAAGTFTNLTANTGISGTLTGNVTGNVTGNLTGNVTGNLTGNVTGNVTASTGSSTFNNVTVNGTLDVTGTTIANVTDPVLAQDAATKNYVDTADALKLNLTGGAMSGAIAMGTNKITGLGTPTATADAATKGYVDTSVANVIDSAPAALDTLNELAAALGDDANFSTTVTNSIATKLPLAGGTMSGAIAMGTNKITGLGDPTSAQDGATKTYVDTADALKLNLSGGTMSGAIAMGTSKITGLGDPTANQDAATKTYVDTADATKLNLSGGTMTGNIVLGANKATSTATPTTADDLTRKAYVDSILGSATAAATSAANAATSETNAATSETNAGNSATAAASSATDAATSYDNFDDRYLGQKTSDPSVDNDGDPLLTGALYFNTTDDKMKVYTGSAWADVAPTATSITESQISDLGTTIMLNLVDDTTPELGGDLTVDNYDIILGDNDFVKFGDSNDFSIYHFGSPFNLDRISSGGSGGLEIAATQSAILKSTSGLVYLRTNSTEEAVVCTPNADVSLYYDNSKKFETTTSGATVTGTITATDATFSGTTAVQLPSGTTAQQPGTPVAGQLRFNSDTGQFEGYNGTAWGAIAGSGGGASGLQDTFMLMGA
jgi:hypothetical protein